MPRDLFWQGESVAKSLYAQFGNTAFTRVKAGTPLAMTPQGAGRIMHCLENRGLAEIGLKNRQVYCRLLANPADCPGIFEKSEAESSAFQIEEKTAAMPA